MRRKKKAGLDLMLERFSLKATKATGNSRLLVACNRHFVSRRVVSAQISRIRFIRDLCGISKANLSKLIDHR
jgi:hypothetical protein